LTISANTGNFCKYPPILAETAKIGGYFQRFSRLADSCRNCGNWRTFAAIEKFDAHLQRLPSVADGQVIIKAITLRGIKKDWAILAFEIQCRSPRRDVVDFLTGKERKPFQTASRLPHM
jgi:hypothetical protein